MNKQQKHVVRSLDNVYNNLTDTYEALMDGETVKGVRNIDKAMAKLRELKNDLMTKDKY